MSRKSRANRGSVFKARKARKGWGWVTLAAVRLFTRLEEAIRR